MLSIIIKKISLYLFLSFFSFFYVKDKTEVWSVSRFTSLALSNDAQGCKFSFKTDFRRFLLGKYDTERMHIHDVLQLLNGPVETIYSLY